MYKFFIINFIICLLNMLVNCEEVKSSNYYCVNRYVTLKCTPGHVIIVKRTEHLYRHRPCSDHILNDLGSVSASLLNYCKIFDERCEYYKSECNGKQECRIRVIKNSHQFGVFGNCDFESKFVNVLYTCVPNEFDKIASFDICHESPRVIFELNEGFIHSPDYPDYYHNSKDCHLSIRTRQERIAIYLLVLNMERKGIFSRKPHDFLQVQGGEKFHGKNVPAQFFYNGTEEKVEIYFETDWGTTIYLESPTGFLLYFKRK